MKPVTFAAAWLCVSLPLHAVPTAINDAFTTPEDTPAGSSAVNLVNASFESGGSVPSFSLPNTWQAIDLATTAAGGNNTYPLDEENLSWKAAGFSTSTSTIAGWRSATLPAQGGGISNANFSAVPATLGGLVPGGPNTVNTYLFRNQFTMTAAQAAHPSWNFNLLADDGCIIYVNGVEKYRLNYPGNVTVEPNAVVGGNGGDENNYTTALVDLAGAFVAGQNVIAIELHQNSTDSSDAGLDFAMTPADTGSTAGFTGVDDAFFGTANGGDSSQAYSATTGFNGGGALRVQMGNTFTFGNQAVSGAWRRSFTLATAATVSLSFRYRMVSGQDYDNGEYQEVICDVNGTQYGTVTAPSTHPSVHFLTGNGNGGGAMDTGWQQRTFNISLAAGNHSLSLGGYANAGSRGFQGNAQESFTIDFDDVLLQVPGSVSLLANDTGGVAPVTAEKVSDPANGTVTVNADGSFNYVPAANFHGTDSFTYRAVDNTGASTPATVALTITAVNDAPVAANDGPFTTVQGTQLTVAPAAGVLLNDTDVDNPASSLTAVLSTASPNGTTALNADGSFTFTPSAGFAGTTTFTYRASDGSAQSTPATVTINVTDVPDAPVAADDAYTVVKNVPLNVSATAASTITETVFDQGSNWRYFNSTVLAERNQGTAWRTTEYTEVPALWPTGAGQLGYGNGDEATVIEDNTTPGFTTGAQDHFATYYFRRNFDVENVHLVTSALLEGIYDDTLSIYLNGLHSARSQELATAGAPLDMAWDFFPSVNVGNNSTGSWTLNRSVPGEGVNALVEGTNLIACEVHQNGAASSDVSFDLRLRLTRTVYGGVLANDTDADAGQAATLTAAVIAQPAHGSVVLNANGTFTYTPVTGYTGPDSFTYRATDTTSLTSNVATVNITVITGPNAAPVANPESYSIAEDNLLAVTEAENGILENDTDAEGDPFIPSVVTQPAHGLLQLNNNGTFTYTPAANYHGPDSFTYRNTDTRPGPPATVSITVTPVNDVPLATNDTYSGDPGVPFSINAAQGVLANDTDVDAGNTLTAELVSAPATGELTLNTNGSFTFTAATGGLYTFTYRANDGTANSSAATVTIALNGVPATLPDSYSIDEDGVLSPAAGVLANDIDPEGQPLTASLAAGVQHGTLTLNANGAFTYTPAANYSGSDSFSYRASDGTRQSNPVTVSLTVNAVNDAPVAVADTYGVRLDTALEITAASGVLRNDADVDSTSLSAQLISSPATGVLALAADGSFTYSPEAGFSGTETFSYRISDGALLSNTATVTLNISADLNTISISEIMYNPPGSTGVQEEFIEIYNYGDAAVDLTGWEFTKGVNYVFPAGTLLAAKGYLAIPANRTAFLAKYPAVANVTSTGWGTASSLGNGGELIRLKNAAGTDVDEVEYSDSGDWATRKIVNVWDATNTPGAAPAPVGNLDTDPGLEWVTAADPDPEIGNMGGASIQLINHGLTNNAGQNWAASTPTPSAANAVVARTNSAPLIRDVIHSPAVPNRTQQVFVTARITDEQASGATASTFYRTWGASSANPNEPAFIEVSMLDNGLRNDGAAGDGVFGAVIPAQSLGTVVEFYVRATDGTNARTWPAPTLDIDGLNPVQNANCLYQVNEDVWTDPRPLYQVVLTGADNASWNAGLSNRQTNVGPNVTVIFRQGGQSDVRYLSQIRSRGNSSRSDTPMNLRLDTPGDAPWNGRTAFTLNYKYSYSQYLSSRLFEAGGVPVEKAGVVGMRLNGANRILDQNGVRTFGMYCDLIPRGGDTVAEWFPGDDNGNAYGKIRGNVRWRVAPDPALPTIHPTAGYAVGGYINEGYWKQTNAAQNDWTDLHAWMQSLQQGASDGSDFHTVIANTVDIDQWCRFLAMSTIINHAETNMANGDDDDYSIYFGADRRCRIIAHDLDTCFNLNAIGLGDEQAPPTLSIYQCTEPNYPTDNATLPQMEKFYRNPVTGRKFKAALRHYLDTVFAKPNFDATVDRLLDSQWMGNQYSPSGDAIRSHIKSFLDTRRATIETFLPTAFTASTTLAMQNGYPRSTSATDLGALGGKIDPARTAEVRVNGTKVITNPYGSTGATDNSWSAGTAVTLKPGLNTLVCTAHDETGSVFATQTVSIWYDAAGTNKSGALAASETWTAAGGPYNVTAALSVPANVVLTIEPGTTVFVASGAGISVTGGGRLVAQGTAASGITFARNPGGSGTWNGITINGASAEPTRISYATINNNGDTAVHAQNGANVELDHLTFLNPAMRYIEVDASSFLIRDCVFPSSTAAFEPVHGSGGIAAGGRGIIQDCWFGKTMGYNDSIDFTGGNRPGPVLHILRCVFSGSDDDILDLDSTDAWIEGCVFMHAHKNGSPDSASAISGGQDNNDRSQVTIINNLFYDNDHAVTMKQGNATVGTNDPAAGNSAVLLYNTIVRTTKTGGEETISAVLNFDDVNESGSVAGEGRGYHLEGNIIWDAEGLVRDYVPANSALVMTNNYLPAAPPATAVASGNVVGDPLLQLSLIPTPATATAEQVMAALRPQLCSPALAAGIGADLSRKGIFAAVPPASVWPSSVTLQPAPSGSFTPAAQAAWAFGYTHYKYSLDGGAESAETPVATPLSLSGLADGSHTLNIWGKTDGGLWQSAPTVITFTTAVGVPAVSLSEVLADSATSPDSVELHNWGTSEASLTGLTLTDDALVPDKFAFTTGTTIPAGGYLVVDAAQLGFNLSRGGETLQLRSGTTLLDSVVFGPQISGYSIARTRSSGWQLSNPTPAAANTAVCELGTGSALRINEWLGSNNLIVDRDFVELYNGETKPVRLTGWSVSDDYRNEPGQNTFPANSFIAASGFLELIADADIAAGPDHLSFKVSRLHDSIALLNPALAPVDVVYVLPGNPDVSQGRLPDGSVTSAYLTAPTPGFSNGSDLTADNAVLSGLRITELMFAPTGSGPEFIEFKNISAAPLTVPGVSFESGVTFTFPATTIPAGGYAVITNVTPSAFATAYPGVSAVQWSGGRLDNNGESVRIVTPAYALGILDFRYEGTWYPETRSGASLEIINPAAAVSTWGLKESWQPSVPSPGGPGVFGVLVPEDFTLSISDTAILHGFVSPGIHAAGSITVAWSKVSGPGTVTFTAPNNKDTDATFSAPGVYSLRLTATPPGGAPDASDTVQITVEAGFDSYAAWTSRTLSGFSAAQQAGNADADGDSVPNAVEYVMGTNPAVPSAGPRLVTENGVLSIEYRVRKNLDPAVQIIPQISSGLDAWEHGPEVLNDILISEDAESELHIVETYELIGGSERQYLRLKVVLP